MVILDDLNPKDHLLRKIDAVIDFNFVREKVKHLYCEDNGRPAIDPVVLFIISTDICLIKKLTRPFAGAGVSAI